MRTLVWLREAQHDLEDINVYLSEIAGSEVAAKVINSIIASVQPLTGFPSLGHPSPTDDDVREFVVTGLSYLIPYTVQP